jgi:hypothetical protein
LNCMLKSLKNKLKRFTTLREIYVHYRYLRNPPLLGMTNNAERRYFEKYGASVYSGAGEVIDLGCWLGSTTIPLIKGLLHNKNWRGSKRKLHAYDTFIWYDRWNYKVVNTPLYRRYKEGDSFLDEYERRVKRYRKFIEIHAGDLNKIGWNGGEIEFILIDAMKSWELANGIMHHFFHFLIPGRSIILHQDFAHYFTPWIHLIQYRFKEYFEVFDDVKNSSSILFIYKKKIPQTDLDVSYGFGDFSDSEVSDAFQYSINISDSRKHPNIAAAHIMVYVHQDRLETARQLLSKYHELGSIEKSELVIVKDLIS